MQKLKFSRRAYGFAVVALIILKVAGVVVVLSAPQTYAILRHVDTAIMITLALVVGGRFADVGWPHWLGITLVLLISGVLPVVLFLASPRLPGPGGNPLDVVSDLGWISTVLLAIPLIVAGIKRSSANVDAGNGGKRVGIDERKEPTFP